MTMLYKGIQFDALTIELKDGTVVDSRYIKEENWDLNSVKCIWGYICQECADKNNFDTTNLPEEGGMLCYVEGCTSNKGLSILIEDKEELERVSPLYTGTMFYHSHGADSGMNQYSGTQVEIIRPLTNQEADLWDVGNMYRCRFSDGFETDVFEDELSKPVIL